MISNFIKSYHLPDGYVINGDDLVIPKLLLDDVRQVKDILDLAKVEAHLIYEQSIKIALDDANKITTEASLFAQKQVWLQAAECLLVLSNWQKEYSENAYYHSEQAIKITVQQLLLSVPPDWPARSSMNLLLQQWSGHGEAILMFNPQDLIQLQQSLPVNLKNISRPDPSLNSGQCLLRTSHADIRADYKLNVESMVELFDNIHSNSQKVID